jgi:UDP:flavonoid glycosyltransferase YjiC (YdhE family)
VQTPGWRAVFPARMMRTMRVLFSCVPLEGHLRPLLPLARALAATGHEVTFATGADRREQIHSAGFAHLVAGPPEHDVRGAAAEIRRELLALPVEARRRFGFSRIFALLHAPRKLPDLLDQLRSRPFDAIVHDSADLAAPIAASALGLPLVNHSFGAMVPLSVLDYASELAAPLWRSAGLEPEPYAGAFRGLYVDISPPCFAWEEPQGTSIRLHPFEAEAGEAPAWLGGLGSPLVYATLGTIFNEPALLQSLLAGLDQVPAALVTTGRDVDPTSVGTVPQRVRLEQFVPQAQVFPLCAAVLAHGGSGTTLGALAHGLPLLLVPQGADQFDNAARCERAGAAIVLRPDELTADAVRASLRRLLDEPSYRSAAQAVAAEIAAMPTAVEAVPAIEAYLTAG